jgi:hypothetical protein
MDSGTGSLTQSPEAASATGSITRVAQSHAPERAGLAAARGLVPMSSSTVASRHPGPSKDVRRAGLAARRRARAARILVDLYGKPDDLTPETIDAMAGAVVAAVSALSRPTNEQVEAVGRILRRAEQRRSVSA